MTFVIARALSSRGAASLLLVAALGCRSATPAPAPAPVTVVTGDLPIKHTPQPTSVAITARDAMTRLYIVADDSMMGRRAGGVGGAMGTAYIAAEVRSMGLEPAGDSGTFFQNLPLMRRGVDSSSTLSVEAAPLALWTDFIPLPEFQGSAFSGTTKLEGVTAIYGGRLGDAGSLISPAQAQGKLVILAARLGVEGRPVPGLGDDANQRYGGAAGVAFATIDVTPAQTLAFLHAWPTGMFTGTQPRKAAGAFLLTNAAASKLLGAPIEGLKPGTIGKKVSAAMKYGEMPTAGPAQNVVAILRGSDPVLRNEFVAIGAHNDHVGIRGAPLDHDSVKVFNMILRRQGAEEPPKPGTPDDWARIRMMIDSIRALRAPRMDSVFNGADDDGSGTVGVLEVAQALSGAKQRPKRSILFVWHTAEELGLLGSEYFTDHPTVPRDSIVAQINIDMIGRGGANDSPAGGPGYLQVLGPRRLSSEYASIVENVNTTGRHGLRFDYSFDADGHPNQFYCRSDHERYARYGIPIVFLSTGGHPDYHMLSDEPQYIDYDRLAQVATYVADLAATVANLDHRVVVDKPKPDPRAPCRQ